MKLHVHLFHQDLDITAETETDMGARRSIVIVGTNVDGFADAFADAFADEFADADADAEGY
jgi:hypothetical protein